MSRGNGEYAIARQVREWFYTSEKKRLTMTDIDLPPFPPLAIHYLRMRVRDLSPNEYWATSRWDMEMALAIQDARDEGITDARETYGGTQE
jgi:hypothetical protein